MNGVINVSTEQLRSTASEFSTLGQQVASLTSEMTNTVTGLSSAWEGEAAQAYINKFKGLDDDIHTTGVLTEKKGIVALPAGQAHAFSIALDFH